MKVLVSIPLQELRLVADDGSTIRRWAISTAANGPGEQSGSGCTPRGRHIVRARIGEGLPENTVFVRRRPTGELYSVELAARMPERDWILTRILWLSGCEPGFNRLGEVDSMRRYIYIHGSPDTSPMGVAVSHGCIRMRNVDILELFDRVPVGTAVEISDRSS
jgi:lipoprotein-anchoring transpeptidase ErfK/SrfK